MRDERVKVAMLGIFPPVRGGIATNIQNLLKSPLKDKYIFLNFRTMSKKQGTPEYFEEKIYLKVCRVVFDLSHFLCFLPAKSPRIVHINTSFGIWSFWRDSVYLLTSKLFRKRVFFQIHGGELNEFWRHSANVTKALIKGILRLPEAIAVLSSEQRSAFLEIGLEKKVKILPNAVDLDSFIAPVDCRSQFGIPQDCVVVSFVAGRFVREKGGMDLLKTVPLVIEKQKKILFVFAGGGGEKELMLRFCEQQDIQDFVKFVGYLPNDVIGHLQLASDIFAFPTYYSEGLPLVILEAMAAGLPVISTPIRAIPEVIENGINGFLVEPKNHRLLAEAIIRLAENQELRKEIGQRNIQKIREKYDLKVVAQIFDENYQKLLSPEKTEFTVARNGK